MKTDSIRARSAESGFTLVEMLMAVSILVIIGGAAYFSFKIAVDVYHSTEGRIIAAQRTRVAMDSLVTDLSNSQLSLEDPMLALYSEDGPSQTGDRDMISFVTLVKTDPDPFLQQLMSFQGQNVTQTPLPLLSDVQRVAYFVAPEPSSTQGATQTPNFRETFTEQSGEQQNEPLALFRITTTSLDPQTVLSSLLETGEVPQTDENGEPIYANVATLVAGLVSFDLKYFDAESEAWRDSWDDTEALPAAVQVFVTVQGDTRQPASPSAAQSTAQQQQQAAQQAAGMTQSTMVHLSKNVVSGVAQEGEPAL